MPESLRVIDYVSVDLFLDPDGQIISAALPQGKGQAHETPIGENVLPLGLGHGPEALPARVAKAQCLHYCPDVGRKTTHGWVRLAPLPSCLKSQPVDPPSLRGSRPRNPDRR